VSDIEEQSESGSRFRLTAWRVPLLIAVGVVIVDQFSKQWALSALGDGRDIHVIWTLQWNLTFNSGMAFSRGEGLGPLIAVVATLVIVWLLLSLNRDATKMSIAGMGLVIGGAAGNLVDRLFRGDAWLRGAVVDFVDFQWFPIFNVADIAINVGAGLLILNAYLQSRCDPEMREADDDSAADVTTEPT